MAAIYELLHAQADLLLVEATIEFLAARQACASSNALANRNRADEAQLQLNDATVAERNIENLRSRAESLKSSANAIPDLNRGQFCKDVTGTLAKLAKEPPRSKADLDALKAQADAFLLAGVGDLSANGRTLLPQ